MPTKQFKDFNKEAKDLVTKNFPAPGLWKIEVKSKGGDREPILSATADYSEKKKGVNVDVDYNIKQYNLKTKTNIDADGIVKPKVTLDVQPGHKIEATLNSLKVDSDFEVTYEGEFACGAAVYDKVTKTKGELHLSYPVGPLTVGGSVAYAFQKSQIAWGVGLRYADKNLTAHTSTDALKTFETTVYVPLKVDKCTAKLAAQVVCGHNAFKGFAVVEAPLDCVGLKNLTARVKVANDLSCALSLIAKVAQNWTAVVSVNCQNVTKFGVHLTRE